MMEIKKTKTALGLSRNTTAALAYLVGWVSGLIVLLLEKEDQFIRFHAAQSLVFFGGLSLIRFIPFVGWKIFPFISLLGLVVWIICLVKAYQGDEFEIPVVGAFVKEQLKKN